MICLIKPIRTPNIPESVCCKGGTVYCSVIAIPRFIVGIAVEGPPAYKAIGGYIRRKILRMADTRKGKQQG